MPGDVKTRIHAVTARRSLLPTSQTRTALGAPSDTLSQPRLGAVRGFHVPFEKYAGVGAGYRPGSAWATRTQTIDVLPASNTFLVKRGNHLRLFTFTVFIADSDLFTLPAI